MIIRQFRPSDAEAASTLIIACLKQENRKFYPEDVITNMIQMYTPEKLLEIAQRQLFLVAVQYEDIIGTATFNENTFGSVFVNPKFHRMGVGTKLMESLEHLARMNGVSKVILHASINAVGFYEKMGFVQGNLVEDDKFGKSYAMTKYLQDS